jgi:hypothetical protein
MHPWSLFVSERRLPVLGREGAEVVLIRHPGQPSQDILQVRQRVFPMALTGDDKGVQDRGALPSVSVRPASPIVTLSDFSYDPMVTIGHAPMVTIRLKAPVASSRA